MHMDGNIISSTAYFKSCVAELTKLVEKDISNALHDLFAPEFDR